MGNLVKVENRELANFRREADQLDLRRQRASELGEPLERSERLVSHYKRTFYRLARACATEDQSQIIDAMQEISQNVTIDFSLWLVEEAGRTPKSHPMRSMIEDVGAWYTYFQLAHGVPPPVFPEEELAANPYLKEAAETYLDEEKSLANAKRIQGFDEFLGNLSALNENFLSDTKNMHKLKFEMEYITRQHEDAIELIIQSPVERWNLSKFFKETKTSPLFLSMALDNIQDSISKEEQEDSSRIEKLTQLRQMLENLMYGSSNGGSEEAVLNTTEASLQSLKQASRVLEESRPILPPSKPPTKVTSGKFLDVPGSSETSLDSINVIVPPQSLEELREKVKPKYPPPRLGSTKDVGSMFITDRLFGLDVLEVPANSEVLSGSTSSNALSDVSEDREDLSEKERYLLDENEVLRREIFILKNGIKSMQKEMESLRTQLGESNKDSKR